MGLSSIEHWWYGLLQALFEDQSLQQHPTFHSNEDEELRYQEAAPCATWALSPIKTMIPASIRQAIDFMPRRRFCRVAICLLAPYAGTTITSARSIGEVQLQLRVRQYLPDIGGRRIKRRESELREKRDSRSSTRRSGQHPT